MWGCEIPQQKMACLRSACTFVKKSFSVRKMLVSFLLVVLFCAMAIVWTEPYFGYGPLSYMPNHERTTTKLLTVTESLNKQIHETSTEGKLLQAVNRLSFKVMTPSLLMLEDLYFIPSTYTLVHYKNAVLQQPQVHCGEDEFILILVPSHPDSVRERRAIRETWGTVARGRAWPGSGKSYPVKLVFVLGVNVPSPLLERAGSAKIKDDRQNERFEKNMRYFPVENKTRIFSHKYNKISSQLFNTKTSSEYKNIKYTNTEKFNQAYSTIYNHFKENINDKVTRHDIKRRESESDVTIDELPAEELTEDATSRGYRTVGLSLVANQQPRNTVTRPNFYKTEPDLTQEISSFNDILQFDMIDSYTNLTRKIILALQWSVKVCSSAKYILKVDQDVFVNVPLLTTFLKHYGENNSIYGHIHPHSSVQRYGKWAVSKTALPIPKYPIYVAGNAYVLSKDAAEKIIDLAPHFPYVLVEDAFITGVLASVGGVNRVFVGGFTRWTDPRPDPCDFVRGRKYVGNNFTDYDHRVFWREIIDNGLTSCEK